MHQRTRHGLRHVLRCPSHHARGYQSLAMSLNAPPTPPSFTFPHTPREPHLTGLGTVMARFKNFPDRKHQARVEFFRNFVGSDYALKEEQLLLALYPGREHTLELQQGETLTITMSSTLERMGKNLMNLEMVKYLVEFGAKVSVDKTEVLESSLYAKLRKAQTINGFVQSSGIERNVYIPHTQLARHRAAQTSLFVLIGSICYTHGKPKAGEFIGERVFGGKGGMFEIASKA